MRRKREIRPFSSEWIKPVKTRHEQCELSDTVKRSVSVIRFFRRQRQKRMYESENVTMFKSENVKE